MRYINDDDRDLLQDELHAQWAVEKIKSLGKREDNQPFFMGVGFVRPHTPMHVPDQYFDLFPIEDIQLENWKKDDTDDTFWSDNFDANQKGARYFRTLLASYEGNREIAIKNFLQAYLACVAFVDVQVGKVLDALENSKFKDNTIVIFTSDHGWQMGEKNYLFKNSPWEESTRIPMLIKTSKVSAGIKVEQPVSLIDLYPTLIELCVLKGSHKKNENAGKLGGYSLKPFLDNQPEQWKGPNGALTVIGNYGINIPTEKQNFSYRTKNWRYIRYSNGAEELYNHQTDSYELDNLADDKKYKNVKLKLIKEMESLINI
jgi:arylsulfatase A-like enzyme